VRALLHAADPQQETVRSDVPKYSATGIYRVRGVHVRLGGALGLANRTIGLHDSPLEGAGFKLRVPLAEAQRPERLYRHYGSRASLGFLTA
jgi:hypothetical protein